MILRTIFVALFSTALAGQSLSNRPKFEDYPVKQIYSGTPAQPKLIGDQRTFRTVIRRGAKSPVEFAGHYTVPRFGCGTECSGFYVVDSVTGKVYDGFGITDLPWKWREKQTGELPDRIQFLPGSRLMKFNGCPNERDCGFYDYIMVDGVGLRLVKKQPLPHEFQP